jgi:hypothetical protein
MLRKVIINFQKCKDQKKKLNELGEIPTSSLFFAFFQPSAADY